MLNGWSMSNHAVERALDMALSGEEIRHVLVHPQVKQKTHPAGYPEGYETWSGPRIALIVNPAERVVVTCLWRGLVYTRGTESEPFRDSP